MIYYYEVRKNITDSEILGMINSQDFREFKNNHMYICDVSNANFFIFEGKYYRAAWMKVVPGFEELYPTLSLDLITKDKYEEFLKNKENAV